MAAASRASAGRIFILKAFEALVIRKFPPQHSRNPGGLQVEAAPVHANWARRSVHASNFLFGVEENCYRAVIDQLYFHMRLENAGLNPNAKRPQASDEFFL